MNVHNLPDAPALRQKLLAEHEQRIKELEMRADTQGEIIEELKELLSRVESLIGGGIR